MYLVLQESGIVFSREKALELDKRMNNIGLLESVENPIIVSTKDQLIKMKVFYANEIKKCCSKAQNLDFIIAQYEVPEYQPKKFFREKHPCL
jgi:hypothetical protein